MFDDQMEYAGPDQVWGYLRAENPSPCALCDRLYDDKEMCSFSCKGLVLWKANDDDNGVDRCEGQIDLLPGQDVMCEGCDIPLEYEDGVLFCPSCSRVSLRVDRQMEAVDAALRAGWDVELICLVMEARKDVVERRRAKIEGPQDRYYDRRKRAEIVEYAVEFGGKEAANKYGVHPESVNRYMREFGLGKKQRYVQLKKVAMGLLGRGNSVGEVADRIGVSVKTIKKWRKILVAGGNGQ